MHSSLRRGAVTIVLAVTTLAVSVATAGANPRVTDPFYSYSGSKPLAQIKPGTVLGTRTLPYHIANIPLPVKTVQLLYRTSDALGRPAVNVTSVIVPLTGQPDPRLVAYGSFYDSLDPRDQPSMAISGQSNPTLGGALANVESLMLASLTGQGFTVMITDTEGQNADFAAGPEYGMTTLDAIRAVLNSGDVDMPDATRVGLVGYSGGAIATEWAAELAPRYAPDVNRLLVGATMGGVLVDPAHNLHYVNSSTMWSGVMPMALIGIARAYDIDLTPYMSDLGKKLNSELQNASIVDVLGRYPGLRWRDLAKPEYQVPESVPIYVQVANRLIMGAGGAPTVPLAIYQGAGGELEGTSGLTVGIGPGDGVMIAGDVRTLARQYCAAGVPVEYHQYDDLSHTGASTPWREAAPGWLAARFAGTPAAQNCASIKPGNPLDPIPTPVPPQQPQKGADTPLPSIAIPALPPALHGYTAPETPVPSGGQSVGAASAPQASVRSIRAASRRAVRVDVLCDGTAAQACHVALKLTVRVKGRVRAAGTLRATVRGGSAVTRTVRLSAAARRLLAGKRKAVVALRATQAGQGAPRALTARRITIKL